jgi:hypothetical protein
VESVPRQLPARSGGVVATTAPRCPILDGDTITVDDGYDERKVIDILNGERINYSRST